MLKLWRLEKAQACQKTSPWVPASQWICWVTFTDIQHLLLKRRGPMISHGPSWAIDTFLEKGLWQLFFIFTDNRQKHKRQRKGESKERKKNWLKFEEALIYQEKVRIWMNSRNQWWQWPNFIGDGIMASLFGKIEIF